MFCVVGPSLSVLNNKQSARGKVKGKEYRWIKVQYEPPAVEFDECVEEASEDRCDRKPGMYFHQFVTDEMLQDIAEETCTVYRNRESQLTQLPKKLRIKIKYGNLVNGYKNCKNNFFAYLLKYVMRLIKLWSHSKENLINMFISQQNLTNGRLMCGDTLDRVAFFMMFVKVQKILTERNLMLVLLEMLSRN